MKRYFICELIEYSRTYILNSNFNPLFLSCKKILQASETSPNRFISPLNQN